MKFLMFFVFIVICQYSMAQGDVFTLGNMEMREQNYQKAEYYYRLAVEREPNNAIIINSLGTSLMAQKKYIEAEPVFISAIDKDTNYHPTFWSLALCTTRQHKDSLTIEWYERFIRVADRQNISVTQAHLNEVMCYERLLRSNGIVESQYYNLLHHANRFMVLFPDAPEIRPLQELLSRLNAVVPDFKTPGQRFVYKG